MIKGIQIIGIIVGLYLVFQTLSNYKRGNYGMRRTTIQVFIWSSMIILFLNPSLALLILPILTTQDMIMSVTIIGLLLSFLLITYLSQQISELNRKITDLVQNLALNDYINLIKKNNNNDK